MWGFTVTQIFVVINSLSQMLLIALTCTQNIPLTAFGMKQNKRCVTHLLWDCTSCALININKADKIRISMADMIHINTEAVAAFFNEEKHPCLLKLSNCQRSVSECLILMCMLGDKVYPTGNTASKLPVIHTD